MIRLTALGGALEFYDFTIYALFAPYLAQHFFSHSSPLISLLQTFLVFALGYFARPFGGIIFGFLGDRFGRKTSFSFSVLLMASATLLIGCLPDENSIGILAPLGLITLRLVQGFSVGGEIPGAAIFTLEHAPPNKKGLFNGIVFMSITLGNSLGAIVGLILTTYLTQPQMQAWGWRVPFIFGFALGIISYFLRKNACETPVFLASMQEEKCSNPPFFRVFNSFKKQIFTAILLTAVSASLISLFLYLPTYLSSSLKIDGARTYLINFTAFISFGLATGFFGWLSDCVQRKTLLSAGAILLIFCSYTLFHGLVLFGKQFIWYFVLGFAVVGGMINGSYVIMICELFPASCRFRGVGLSYSLGLALFGGISPVAFTWLIQAFESKEAPFVFILICSILTLLGIFKYEPTAIRVVPSPLREGKT